LSLSELKPSFSGLKRLRGPGSASADPLSVRNDHHKTRRSKKRKYVSDGVPVQIVSTSGMSFVPGTFHDYTLREALESDMIIMFYDHTLIDTFNKIVVMFNEFLRERNTLQQYTPIIVLIVDVASERVDATEGTYTACTRDVKSHPHWFTIQDPHAELNSEYLSQKAIQQQLDELIMSSMFPVHSIVFNSSVDYAFLSALFRTFMGSIIEKRRD
ncbi:hypothetical protein YASMINEVIRUS_1375, partial [Yasminevirus sp. GU-2018]